MKKIVNRIVSLTLLLALTVTVLGGCSTKAGEEGGALTEAEANEVVAVLGDEEILLKEAVYYTRLFQAEQEMLFMDIYGEDMWTSEEDGETLADELKDYVMDYINEVHLVNAHALDYGVQLTEDELQVIDFIAPQRMEEYSQEVLDAAGATEEYVKEMMAQEALYEKTVEAIQLSVEEVTDDEALQASVRYVSILQLGGFDENDNVVDIDDSELESLRETAQSISAAARAGTDLGKAAEDEGYIAVDIYLGEGNEYLDKALVDAAIELEEGQISDVVEGDGAFYIIEMLDREDEEGTALKKEELMTIRQEEALPELLEKWASKTSFVVDEEVWKTIVVDEIIYVPAKTSQAGEADEE